MTGQPMTQQQLFHDIYDVIMEMREETAYAKFSPVPEKIMNTIIYCYEKGFLFFNGKCLMMGKAYQPWYNDDTHATDILLYTRKEYRGQGLAVEALEAFFQWATAIGANDVKISQSTGITGTEFNKLANKFNLKKIGYVYNV